MSAEHQAHGCSRRMCEQIVRIVGRMAHQDKRLPFNASDGTWDRLVRVGLPAYRVIETSKPHAASASLDGNMGIDKNRDSVGSECARDLGTAQPMIVIAKD